MVPTTTGTRAGGTNAGKGTPVTVALPKPLQVYRGIVIELLSGETLMLEVFSRHTFGERYLTALRLGEGTLFYLLYALVVSGFGLDGLRLLTGVSSVWEFVSRIPWALVVYYFAFLALGAFHRFEIFYRNLTSDQVVHSHSYGVSWPFRWLAGRQVGRFLTVDEWIIYRYVEPWAWLMVGGLIVLVNGLWQVSRGMVGLVNSQAGFGALGGWIVLMSFLLWWKNEAVYAQQREQELDLSDGRIVAAAQAVGNRSIPMEATGGYRVTPIPRALDTDQDGLLDDDEAILRRFLRGYGSEGETP